MSSKNYEVIGRKANEPRGFFDEIRKRTHAGEEARRMGFVADVGPSDLTPTAPLQDDEDKAIFDEIRAKKRNQVQTEKATQETRRSRYLAQADGEPQ